MVFNLALLGAAYVVAVAAILFFTIQFGGNHTNPPVVQEPQWPSPEVRQMVVRACYDCHSNETKWPWYSSVAPVSWLVQHDVDEGREELNFSQWGIIRYDGEEAAELVLDGEMPPWFYVVFHPEADLSETEKQTLARALESLLGPGRDRDN